MRIYYTADGSIAHAVKDADWPRPIPSNEPLFFLYVEENVANLPELRRLLRSLSSLSRTPTMPPVPASWRVEIPASGRLIRTNGTPWNPSTTAQRTDWDSQLQAMMNRAIEIRDTVVGANLNTSQQAIRDLAIGVLRILRFIDWFRN